MSDYLPFEKAIEALDQSAASLRRAGERLDEAAQLEERAQRQLAFLYSKLTPWQRAMVARHPARPHINHYIAGLLDDFMPLGGDRAFADDQAMIGGLASFQGRPVVVMGHAKGEDTASRLKHNFGMAKPEGYRKAIRLMDLADKFGLPVITLVDTPGAFPGMDAEERGQAEAIARSTERCLSLGVPIIAVIAGEGGSGGAVALAAANRVLMLEHSIYSVISPEGCASILWRSAARAAEAAEAMKITASELLRLGVIDRIVYEPAGGAHRDHATMIKRVGVALAAELAALGPMSSGDLRAERRTKYLQIGRQLPAGSDQH
ncbi:acetyl-CoA carboxylase carboxyltransferase subunit alpha [Sphingomonas sp. 28-63-12]|uniref:acetyl-CoA carboxylase carboxyltransferase subunit alpha n=1 Tax=Sphingomonas sp. 28-63-12 TaxID=1970434 RepID=UPI000BD6D587|nr:MAG: acetyl-CoA carboxylase carboxyl transferase subunit alpha [Sphingomonas sp. 28-63-12]